ncbi:hypothetical protein BKA66DRAFT_448877 [Pyrenochaeta sp. MPI-SDFR-AT-0127]|nr:hypothetical protein BKA66DRAFT_448877 [Pyrenochaeta sp. MPI-SDFR-AT-0127]
MVATRRGANKAPEAAPATSNTLNAPPKRGGRKKAAVEEVAEPVPAVTKPTKATTTKRKVKAEPEVVEPPVAKKPAANTKATRAAKIETKTELAPAVAKRATRGRKATELDAVEEPAVVEEAPKPVTTRGRKAPAKKTAPATKVEEPAVAEEPIAEEVPKPASRARKAPAKKTLATKEAETPVVEETIAAEPIKPAPRGRKAVAPKALAPAPAIVSRPTRGRNVAAPPQDSPLKAPARKPAKKAAPIVKAKTEPETVEEPFAQYPGYPTTPAHITAPITARTAMRELPQYPNTPAHILAPLSTKDALSALPGYPKTPAHIVAPMSTRVALTELPGYPKTPAHIKAPISVQDAMAELPGYPKTPAHILAPAVPSTTDSEDVTNESPKHSHTPAISNTLVVNDNAVEELPVSAETPIDIQTPPSSRKPLAELIDYPNTPAQTAQSELTTEQLSADGPSTPTQTTTPATELIPELFEAAQMPTQIVWGVTNQEAFAEMPQYPTTPAHIAAPITTRQALAELPDYPKTPAHIAAPMTPRRALAELPDYPTTPAIEIEAAIQEEITASVKKQTPSPLQFPGLDDVSFQFAETSEYTDVDPMEIDTEIPAAETMPKLQLAPLQLAANLPTPDLASPKKSALRSPQKFDTKTPKKAVTWGDAEESELFLYDGPLQGMTFYVDVTSNGKEQNYLFASLLEDLGAKVVKEWVDLDPSHVLYKDGSKSTLEKVLSSKGAVKCVNVGWVLDSEKNRKRMDEGPYLVDLSIAMPTSPLPTTTLKPFTPARTPSKYALPPSSECKSVPTTPTSSEFDRSINFDDKENCEHGVYFDCLDDPKQVRTVPQKKSSFLFSRSPVKTPSKSMFLFNTPVKPMAAIKPFSTMKKRSHESSFPGISMGTPKRFRLF